MIFYTAEYISFPVLNLPKIKINFEDVGNDYTEARHDTLSFSRKGLRNID